MGVGDPGVLGVVLAGGRSTRWGSEKAVAEVDGAPMVARVAAALANGCGTVAVNAPEASGAAAWARAHGLEVLPDPPGGPDGPLAGVLAGLAAAEARGYAWLVSAPCDAPWLPPDLVRRLLAGAGDAPAAAAVTVDGSHPLCTLWSVALRPRLAQALESGAHPSVRAWLTQVGAAEVRFADAHAFANLNTPPERLRLGLFAASLVAGLITAVVGGAMVSVFVQAVVEVVAPSALTGGDMSPAFLPLMLLLPAGAVTAGTFVGVAVMRAGLRRPT